MKIVFVGGGTGGHFYPLIAVAEEIERYAVENQLLQPKKYYLGPTRYDEKALYNAGIRFVFCPAGKMRRTKDALSRIKNFFFPHLPFFWRIKGIIHPVYDFPRCGVQQRWLCQFSGTSRRTNIAHSSSNS